MQKPSSRHKIIKCLSISTNPHNHRITGIMSARRSTEEEALHVVWFEDARSILAKLELASEEDLAGISVWNIMNYHAPLWLVINSMYEILNRASTNRRLIYYIITTRCIPLDQTLMAFYITLFYKFLYIIPLETPLSRATAFIASMRLSPSAS